MARTYDVKGTQDFLIWAVVLFGLGLWAVRDGWFPTPAKLEKYPQRVPLRFEVAGVVDEVPAQTGQEVKSGEVLARLNDAEARRKVKEAEVEIETTPIDDRDKLVRHRRRLETARLALAQHELRAPTNGVLRVVWIKPRDTVTPEDDAAILDPRHHFYPFNKSLAFISLIGAAVCLVIHFKVR
jgi:multidrug resistance efflux pump